MLKVVGKFLQIGQRWLPPAKGIDRRALGCLILASFPSQRSAESAATFEFRGCIRGRAEGIDEALHHILQRNGVNTGKASQIPLALGFFLSRERLWNNAKQTRVRGH
jgi:hypothetical protein